MHKIKLLFILFFFLPPIIIAQGACTDIVLAALELTDSQCDEIGRNQGCYGHQTIFATARQGISDLQFQTPGDIVELAAIEKLEFAGLSPDEEEWGIAIMKVQANLPDTLPGQNVTFLLFGDVSISDATEPIVEIPVRASTGVNVRPLPRTDTSVIASLSSGQAVSATGKLPDNSWLRILLDDGTEGWVFADYLRGDWDSLLAVEPDATVYGPMQAFYFKTGIGQGSCTELTESGILIQTPEGAKSIELIANGLDIRLGSTIFLQTEPGKAMYVYILEGHAILNAFGVTQYVPSGTVSIIPLDENGEVDNSPAYPVPYDELDGLTALLDLLPISISIATPLLEEQIGSEIEAILDNPEIVLDGGGTGEGSSNGLPPSGIWQNTAKVLENTCDPSIIPVGQVSTGYPRLTFSDDYSSMLFDWGGGGDSFTFYRVSDTVYSHISHNTMVLTLSFTSSTSYFLTHRGNYGDPNAGGCIYYQDETGSFVGS